ncbi:MAG: response regulator [Verrucomicrobia bacterium]|nr:response regulator [Verrucomicrobiota bacterium]
MEDDAVVASIYGTKLALAGYEVQTATDGAMGLKLLKSFKPDLVQIDLMLPEVSGVDVISHIRGQPEFKSIPIIVLSNFYVTSLIQAAWKAGATKCLTKVECTPKGMVEIVREVLAAATPAPAPAQATPATPPASPAAKSPPRLLEADVDTTFQAEIRRAFLERAPQLLMNLRRRLHGISKPETDPARQPELFEFCRTVHSLAGNATIAGFNQIADMAGALEALLKELYDKPKHITASSLRTIAHTVDFLGVLFEHSSEAQPKAAAPAMVLVVDDEIISRQAVGLALAKANLAFVSVDGGRLGPGQSQPGLYQRGRLPDRVEIAPGKSLPFDLPGRGDAWPERL